jgi:uncharacterized protein
MNVVEINVYPIKSLRGSTMERARVCSYGLEHDRQWMLVNPESKMITQRECPLLATLTPRVEQDGLRIATTDRGEVLVPYGSASWTGNEVTVDVWGHAYVGVAAIATINQALSEVIGMSCQLLSIRADVSRTKRDVAFHDDAPILIISESSLEDLNQQLAAPLPMNRFRPNIVVRDAAPFDEDGWQRIAVGEALFSAVKPCLRCVTTTVDQATGTPSGPEPLATLAKFRRKGEGVAFGQYYRPEQASATIKLGDAVTVLAANYSQAATPVV